jgi:hypothetical protein
MRGTSGCLAAFGFDPVRDVLRLHRMRHQREADYWD